MSYLKQVSKGLIKTKDFILVTGQEKVGKTTFACSYPNALLMDLEGGSHFIENISRLPKANAFEQVMEQLSEVASTKDLPYETLVIDTLDFLEGMVNKYVCEKNNWVSIDEPAFGKGYGAALAEWDGIISLFKEINQKMNLILIAHTQIKSFNDPMREPYDRHQIKLRDKISAKVKESVDAILFCTYEIHTKTEKGKTKAIGDGSRVIYTQSRPSHEAGNRYGLPYRLPLDYASFKEARTQAQPDKPENIMARIKEILPAIKDKEIQAKAKTAAEKASANAIELSKILNRLETLAAA